MRLHRKCGLRNLRVLLPWLQSGIEPRTGIYQCGDDMKTTLGAAAVVLACSSAAQAQDFSGVFSLGYGENEFADTADRLNESSLKGRFRAQTGNGMSFGLQFGTETKSAPQTDESSNGRNLGADLQFAQQNNLSYGVYAESSAVTANGVDLLSTSAFGLTAGYAANGLNLKGFVGSAALEEQPSAEITALGVTASYQLAPNFTVGANLSQHGVKNGSFVNTASSVGLGAVYQPTPSIGLFGGFTSMDLSSSNDTRLTEMGLGGSYRVNRSGNSPILATLEVLNTDFNSDPDNISFNTIRLGVTFPLGAAARNVSVPINSAADRVFQPIRNVLGASGDTLN